MSSAPANVHLYFGGVRFTLRGPAELRAVAVGVPYGVAEAALAPEPVSSNLPPGVACQVDVEWGPTSVPQAEWGADRTLRWDWQGATCRLQARGVEARLHEVASGHWSAQAQVVPRRGAVEALLNSLAAALLYRRGGAVLHAASVEVDGGVVAFIGPSGAGKSTACRQASARLFSVDRLGLAPNGEGWLAHALPGGTRQVDDSAPSAAVALPLLGILRVRQVPSGARIEPVAGGRKLALLRESVLSASAAPAREALLLAALSGLCQRVPMGELAFALGVPLAPSLSNWLSTPARGHVCAAEVAQP